VTATGTVGQAVAHAQRLQGEAAPGEVLVDEATARIARGAIEVEDRGAALRLVSLDRAAPGVERRLDSPLVGREHELRMLESAHARAIAERSPQLVTLVGPAGVGKSRLAGELVSRVAAEATVLRGRCLSYGDDITFWPIVSLLRAAVGAGETEPAESVSSALTRLLGRDEPALGGLLGLGEPTKPADELSRAFRDLLEALAAQGPVVIVLDDLEHAEQALLDLVDFVVDWSRDVALTVICIGRPNLLEERPAWGGGRPNVVSLALDALSLGDSAALLANLLGGSTLARRATERLVASAEGNPLYLEQMVAMLIDDGALRLEDGRWRAVGELDGIAVPPSIQLLLAARLDRLPPAELAALECAAVEGVVFHRDSLEAAIALRSEVTDVGAALRALVVKGLVRPTTPERAGDEAYRFPHVLIRDTAYNAIPKRVRGRLHEHFSRWIELHARDRVPELEELLGHHLEQAFLLLREVGEEDARLAAQAAVHVEASGDRAHARGDYRSAAGLLRRADLLHAESGRRRLELVPRFVSALRLSGNIAEARWVAEEALGAIRLRADGVLEAHVLLEQCSIRLLSDPQVVLEDVAAVAGRARAVFADAGDESGLAHAYALLGDVSLFACRFREAEAAYENALEHARAAGDAYVASLAHGKLAQSAFLGPRPVGSAIDRCEEIRAEADPSARSQAMAVLGVLQAMRGRFDEARSSIAACRALCEEFGLERALTWLPGFAGCVELLAGDADSAERELRAGYDALLALGETAVLATTSALLAQALERQGRVDDADALTTSGAGTLAAADRVSQIYWRQARARIHARRGELDAARTLAAEAVALAADADMPAVHGAALVDAALLDRSERERLLHAALELFDAKGDEVDVQRVRDALAAG